MIGQIATKAVTSGGNQCHHRLIVIPTFMLRVIAAITETTATTVVPNRDVSIDPR